MAAAAFFSLTPSVYWRYTNLMSYTNLMICAMIGDDCDSRRKGRL